MGGVLWSCGVLLLGFGLGKSVGQKTIDKYILPIEAVVIVVSLIPVAVEFLRARKHSAT
jgi:membrane-associated protein